MAVLALPVSAWSVSRRSSMPNLVKIGPAVQELFKFLQISKWRPAAIFDYEFRDFESTGFFRVRNRRYVPTLVHNRTNRFEVIEIFVNFVFLSAAILDFEK